MNGKQAKILNFLRFTKQMKRNWRKLTQKQKFTLRKKAESTKENMEGKNLTNQALWDLFEK